MGWSEKRGNTWRARFKLPNGKYDSEPGFLTKAQADAYWQAQETDVRRGDWFDASAGESMTFAEWADQWLATIDVSPDTEYNYSKRIRRLNLRWGDVPLSHITTSAYLVWEKATRRELSANFASAILQLFRMIIDDAVAHRPPLLKVSPIPAVNRRRGKYVPPVKEEVPTLTPEQVEQVAENARAVWGLTGYVAMLTKAYCGLRQGELYGLRREWCYPNWPASDPGWPDNPAGRTAERKRVKAAQERYTDMPALRVQWQHQYVRPVEGGKRKPELVLPKYGSVRDLVVPPFLAKLLVELLESHDSEWVFPSMTGGPLLLTDFSTYIWKPVIKGAEERAARSDFRRPAIGPLEGLEDAVPHWLRHAMKRWLDEDGHPRVAVETRMGHRMQGVEDVYSGVTPTMERRIAESLQERWEKARK
ncbi:tyrosine-type recombinase/integrase [Kitasatospora cathayae]|uniref:Integrase n=1 Tax=Kitasatospora cathayae TaxID=3004092 RepID=A0ABY7Q9Z2_9ACTN|nr:integrase [Kitasatospora sp. HUAS 3-15]WBP89468.1 integrase [Kitasatospora sp. HUAS 3-15]